MKKNRGSSRNPTGIKNTSSKKVINKYLCIFSIMILLTSVFIIMPTTVANPNNSWYNSSWSYRKQITIFHNMVDQNLTNFPVLIDIIDNDLLLHAQSNGNDIVFTNKTGTKLAHEIESYSSVNGHLVVWVNIPSLSSTVDTSIYMYYGNPSASNQQNVSGTWNSGFKAVYHLKESWGTNAGRFKDSTANHYNGTLTDANGDSGTDTGIAGPGFRFNGDADFINIGAISHDYPITYSCWLKANNITQPRCAFGRFWNYYYLGTWSWGTGVLRDNIYVNNNFKYSSHSSVSSNVWYLLTVTYDGTTIRYYTNGVEDKNEVMVGSLSATAAPWHIGDNGNGGYFFAGVVDEVRLSNACLSGGWISTYYRNVNSPSTFYTVGPQKWYGPYTLTLTTSGAGSGTITSSPAGPYYYGAVVNISATANVSSRFTGFTGSLTGTTTPQTLIIDGNKSVNAAFTLKGPYTLTLTKSGTGSGTITASPADPYYYGAVVNISAAIANNWSMFSGFTGNLSGTTSPQTLIMNGNKTVNAVFNNKNGSNTLTLTTSGTGSGTITASPAGPYFNATVVTISATPNIGSTFSGFTGDLTGNTTPQTLLVNGNKAVNAAFTLKGYTLNLTTSGTGSGSITASPAGPYYYGAVVTISATADVGSTFSTFTGNLTGTTTPQTLTINGNKTVDATFTRNEYQLLLTTSGTGNGIITANPEGPYYYGTVVTISVNTAVGSRFSGFTGDLTGTTTPQTLTMNGAKAVNAAFTLKGPYTLTLTTNGTGAGTITASSAGPYYYGAVVNISATANVGSFFSGFYGNLTGITTPQTISMDGNKTVNAMFRLYSPGPKDWWNTAWLYRKSIVIDHSKVSENLVNFPMLVNILDSNLSSHTQSNGNDIVFTSKTGTKLAHEIESYDQPTGHLIAWVNIPSLSSTVDTSIYMYYGNPSASNQQNVSGTWNSGFKAVYHLKESWGTNAGRFKDSTRNHYNGTLTDANGNSASDTGVAGPGFRFNGDADFINIGAISYNQPITYSCWLKADNIAQPRCAFGRYWNYYYLGTWSAGSGVLRDNIYVNNYFGYSTHSSVSSNVWYLLTVTYDGTTIRYYTNGVEDKNEVLVGSLSATTAPWHIGDNGNGGYFFAGVVDEVRLSNACLSGGWISTYYRNVNSPSTFYSVGTTMMQTSNSPPVISNEQPMNTSLTVGFNPLLQANVTDPDGNMITCELWTNTSGTWQVISNTIFYTGSGTISSPSTGIVQPLVKYWWKVRSTDDGTHWVSKTFWFKTGADTPLILNVSPQNNIVTTYNPRLSVKVIDYQNDLLHVTFRKKVGTSWQDIATYSGYNGLFFQNTTNMDVTNQTYYWSYNVTDGKNWVNATNHFLAQPFVLKWDFPNAPSTDLGPIAADVNHDGIYEVFMTGTHRIVCVNGSTGHLIWQYNNSRIFFHSPAVLADLNHDGIDEIVIACEFASGGIPPRTLCLHANNGSVYWNVSVPSDYRHFVIADVDGTGYPYVYVVSHVGLGYISKLRGTDGAVLARVRTYYPCHGGMSLADIDNDGKIELVLSDYLYEPGKGISCYDAATLKLKWFCRHRGDPQIPVLVNVDNNRSGILDAVTTQYSYGPVQVVNGSTGLDMPGYGGLTGPSHSPNSAYDIDRDGHIELLDCSDSAVKVFDLFSKTLKTTLPYSSPEPPLMADVIGDSKLEILLTSWAWNQGIVIFNSTYAQVGQIKRGSSRWTLVQDVDNDGQNELLFTDSSDLVCYDTSAYAPIPRVRTDQLGYSERCNGAGVYVPPPGVPQPVLKDESPKNCSLDVLLNPPLSVHAIEYQVHELENYHIVEHHYDKMRITVSSNASGTWQNLTSFTNASNGWFNVTETVMNHADTTYYWRVTAVDINPQAGGITTVKTYHLRTKSAPKIRSVTISTSTPYQRQAVNISANITEDVQMANTRLRVIAPDSSQTNTSLYTYQWTPLAYDDFESGWGNYTPGGSDCSLWQEQMIVNNAYSYTYPLVHHGVWAADIQSNSGTASSFALTNPIDVKTPGYNAIKVEFWMNAYAMYDGYQYYLEYYNGTQWVIRKTYTENQGSFAPSVYTDTTYRFANRYFMHDTVWINKSKYNFPTNMNIRFRCGSGDASSDVYLDQISINATKVQPKLYTSINGYPLTGVYQYSFWCNDTSGNANTSSVYQFTVQADTSPPQISAVQANPSSAYQRVPINVSCSVQDNAGVQDVRAVITDPNTNTVNSSIFANKVNPNTYYLTQTYTTVGTYQFYIWTKDVNGNPNSSSAHQFTVLADTSPPQISAVQANPSSAYQGNPINVSCSAQDNVGLQEVRAIITDPNANTNNYSIIANKVGSSTYYLTQTYTTVGTYQFSIWAKDVNGNTAASTTSSFNITYWPKLTDWSYRKPITISHSKVSKNLTNFPVLIDIHNDSDLAAKALDNFNDILFTNSSVNWLTGHASDRFPHEIESCNGVTGNLTAWVLVPYLSSTQDTVLYMYYGNAGSPNQQQPTLVWSNNYALVQHLNETSGVAYDSTSNNNDGTIQNNVNQTAIGKIDGADWFDGISSLVHIQHANSLDLSTTGTMSAWIKLTSYISNGGIIHKGDLSSWTDEAYGLQLWSNNKLRFYICNSNGDNYLETTNNLGSNTWFYIVSTWNATGRFLYVNGTLNASSASAQSPRITTGGVNIGAQITQSSYYPFNGAIDEVCISSVSRDYGWIHTSYLNQGNPASFYSVGSEESH